MVQISSKETFSKKMFKKAKLATKTAAKKNTGIEEGWKQKAR